MKSPQEQRTFEETKAVVKHDKPIVNHVFIKQDNKGAPISIRSSEKKESDEDRLDEVRKQLLEKIKARNLSQQEEFNETKSAANKVNNMTSLIDAWKLSDASRM